MPKRGKTRRLISLALTAIPILARSTRTPRRGRQPVAAGLRRRPGTTATAMPSEGRAGTEVRPDTTATPGGGDIHLPQPSIWPSALALGVTLLFFGVVTSYGFTLVGGLVTAVSIAGWMGELRHG